MNKGFTLLELVVVIIIVGILATMGVSQYTQARERALYNEAKANLKLILAAERVSRMESDGNVYIACPDTTAINNTLHLLLPTNNSAWSYFVKTYDTNASFCAQADRNSPGSTKNFRIRSAILAGNPDPQVEEDSICP